MILNSIESIKEDTLEYVAMFWSTIALEESLVSYKSNQVYYP